MSPRARRWVFVLALSGFGFAVAAAVRGADFARTFFYQLAWFPVLVAADCALSLRTRERTLLDRPALAVSLLAWSAPVWLLFELANLRLANWYYVLLPRQLSVRWIGTLTAFATVLPALYLAWRWMCALELAGGRARGRGFPVRTRHLVALRALGLFFLVLSLGWPRLFFPLIWGALTLLLEPANYGRDRSRSLLADLSAGSGTRILRLLAAGLVVGLVWETLNWLADARWIYTVPGLERWKVFEMPVPGFLGFPVLALDAFVIYQTLALAGLAVRGWIDEDRAPTRRAKRSSAPSDPPALRRQRGRIVAVALATGAFCGCVLAGMDRYTVDSWHSGIERLPGVDGAVAARLRASGLDSARDLAALDAAELSRRTGISPGEATAVAAAAGLARLRGLGADHAVALARAGIRDVCALARSEETTVGAAVRVSDHRPSVGRPARVRVWLRAAHRACHETLSYRLLRPAAGRIFSATAPLKTGTRDEAAGSQS